jgi:hypothetical protein
MDAQREQETTALVPIEVLPPAAALPSRAEIDIIGLLARSVVAAKGHAVPLTIDSPAKAFAVMLAGWEVGAKPMAALRHMFVVNGRTEPDAQLMMGIVKARDPSARFVFHTRSADLCDVELFRNGRSVVRIAYGEADAERAGLLKKGGPWTQYRPDMMAWAAVKRACRLGAPDLVNAISGVDVGEAGDLMSGLEEEIEAVAQEVRALPAEALVNEGDEPADEGAIEGEAEPVAEEPPTQQPEEPAEGWVFDPGTFLKTCPIHQATWLDGKYGPYHWTTEQGVSCARSKVLREIWLQRVTAKGLDEKAWLKANGFEVWSKLTDERKVLAIAKTNDHPAQAYLQEPKYVAPEEEEPVP